MSVSIDTLLKSSAIHTHTEAAHLAVICEILGALMEKGVLNQGDMINRLEALSKVLMTAPGAEHAVPVVDIFRNYVAQEPKPVPS